MARFAANLAKTQQIRDLFKNQYNRVFLFCRTKVPDLSIFAPICSEARGRQVCRARLVMLVSGEVSSSCRITSTWGTCPSRWVVVERGRGPGRNHSPGWSCLSTEVD